MSAAKSGVFSAALDFFSFDQAKEKSQRQAIAILGNNEFKANHNICFFETMNGKFRRILESQQKLIQRKRTQS